MSAAKTIARATILILTLSILSKILGLGRETAIAYRFGATATTDAFLVAFVLPYLFYGVVGMSLSTVIVPIFSEYVAQGRRDEAWRVMSLVINGVMVVMAVLALAGIVAAPVFATLFGGGFPPGTLALAAKLTAIMMPSIIFMSLAGVFSGILNANNVFGPSAFGSSTMNIVIIVAALVGAQWFGVYGLAAGAVLGSLTWALVQVPALRAVGFRYSFNVQLNHPEVRRVVVLAVPVLLATSIGSIYTMVDWRLASGLAEGSIAALNFANKLMQLPQGLFVVAVTTAIFPTLSRLAAEARLTDMTVTLQRGIKVIILLAVPGAVGLVVLREPVVALLFERGAFDPQATAMTSSALLYFAVGLAAFCLNGPLTRGFFAMQDTRTPLLISLGTLGIKILLSIVLVRILQHAGLALATSLTALLNVIILAVLLQRRLPALFSRSFFTFCLGTLGASAIMGLAVHFLDSYLVTQLVGGGLPLLTRVTLDVAFGGLVFLTAGLLLRLDELWNIIRLGQGLLGARKLTLSSGGKDC